MNKQEIVDKMTRVENILTSDGQEEYLRLLDEFIGLYDKLRGLDNDNTRDISIRCIDKLIDLKILSEDEHNFEIQDLIQDEINEVLGLDIDDNFEITI